MDFTLCGNETIKKFITLEILKEEAHKQLSYYRQRQDDLVARMATDWPNWGCTLDFYTHMILPLLRNSFIFHFINLSEGFELQDVEIRFGHCLLGKLEFISENFELSSKQLLNRRDVDLVDFALYALTGITDIKAIYGDDALPLSGLLKDWKVEFVNRHPLLVRIRDADIGAQAFFALLEGIMRNASKHGRNVEACKVLKADSQSVEIIKGIQQGVRYEEEKSLLVVTEELTPKAKEALSKQLASPPYAESIEQLYSAMRAGLPDKRFSVKIIFCDTWKSVKSLVQVAECRSIASDISEKHGFVIITINRDLIDEPCDPQKAERKIEGKTLVEFISHRFTEGIIDDTGRIRPGNWGIKEIKICAAFLSGQPLQAVNESNPNFILVGETNEKRIWEDKRKRLCYVIRIEKPRLAIALVPETKYPQNKNEWEGVRFVSNVAELIQKDTDYDFLFVDKELEKQAMDFINSNWHIVPRRTVCAEFTFSNAIEFNCELYDKLLFDYMDKLDKSDEINVRIYFEDDDKIKAWKERFRASLRLEEYEDIILELKNGERVKRILLSFLGRDDPKFDPAYDQGYQITICRHTHLKQIGLPNKPRGVPPEASSAFYPYYAQQVSGADPFFSFLLSIEPEQDRLLANLVMRQTVESALLNVLIIDERIAQSLGGLKAKDEPDISLAEKLYWMGIHVAGSVKLDGNTTVWAVSPAEETSGVERLVDVSVSRDGVINNRIDGLPIHILLIHATRLNQIYDSLKSQGLDMNKEAFIQKLRDRIPHIIVHSGRGRTEGDIPEKMPFVEYSTVEKYVLNEPSKFYLIQIVMNVRGENK